MKSIFFMSLLESVYSTVISSFFNTGFRLQVVYTHVSTCFHQHHVGRITWLTEVVRKLLGCLFLAKSPVLHFFCRHHWLLRHPLQYVCFASEVGCECLWSDRGVRHAHLMTRVVLEGVPPPEKKKKKNGKGNVMHLKNLWVIMLHMKKYQMGADPVLDQKQIFPLSLSIFCCCNFHHRQKAQKKQTSAAKDVESSSIFWPTTSRCGSQ